MAQLPAGIVDQQACAVSHPNIGNGCVFQAGNEVIEAGHHFSAHRHEAIDVAKHNCWRLQQTGLREAMSL
jgi:hypothetical protein